MIILKGLLPYLSFLLNNQMNGRLILHFLDHVFNVLTKTRGVRKLRSDGRANDKCHFRFLPVDYPVRLSSGACASNNRELKETTTAMATRTSKSNRFRLAKQQLCTYIMLFCTFLLPSLHDYEVKLPNFTVPMEDLNTIFFFFFELRYTPLEFNSLTNRQHLTN